jgi:hypothetical protein
MQSAHGRYLERHDCSRGKSMVSIRVLKFEVSHTLGVRPPLLVVL